MLSVSVARKPAPALACGALWLRPHVGPNAFGNALGTLLADGTFAGSREQPQPAEDQSDAETARLNRYAAAAGSSGAASPGDGAFSQDVQRRRALLAQGIDPNAPVGVESSVGSSAPASVRAGDFGGSLERIARAQLGASASQRDVNNYVGQLFELNGIADARRVGPDQVITLPGAGTPMASAGLVSYGRDIAVGEQLKAEVAARAAQAATSSNLGMSNQEAYAAYMAAGGRSAGYAGAPAWSGRFETVASMDIAGGGATGGTEQVWISDGPATPYAEQMRNVAGAMKTLGTGVAELAYGAVRNYAARIGARVTSIPIFLTEGAEAAVGYQEAFKDIANYTPSSDGARAIGQALSPVGQAISSVTTAARNAVESRIGDGATTFLAASLQAGLEIYGVASAGKALQGFVDALPATRAFDINPSSGGLRFGESQRGSIDFSRYDSTIKERILGYFSSGNEFELQARAAAGLEKNYSRIYGVGDLADNWAVPDAFRGSSIFEVKDWKDLSLSQQSAIYQSSGRPIELITSPKTEIVRPQLLDLVRNSQGSHSIFDPATRIFHRYDFKTGTYSP